MDKKEIMNSFLKTPYIDKGRSKEYGVDCIGLVYMYGIECGFKLNDVYGYPNTPSNNMLKIGIEEQLEKIKENEIQIGDVVLFRFFDEPTHVALISEIKPKKRIIHAVSGKVNKVIENDIDNRWEKRIVSFYRFKE